MKRTQWILAAVVVLMIGSTALVLAKYKSMQRLGEPGVKTQAIAGSKNLEVILPERVLDYTSEKIEQNEIVTNTLPADTSYGQRRYTASDKFSVQNSVVLMGSDRASLHKPQYCLTGAGLTITKTEVDKIHISQPTDYELPVIKLTFAGQQTQEGRPVDFHGVYVYWFVADHALSADPTGADRMWSMARNLITTGVLQRWAYVSYLATCAPGQEDEAYARLKKLIAAAVPEFQLTPSAGAQVAQVKP